MPSRQLNLVLSLMLAAMLGLAADVALATPPQTINYQGYLTSPTGTPVNTPVVMTFRLYNAVSGGVALYTETQLSVSVTNGGFNAVIGAVTPIPLPFDVPYWLTVQINADGEMSPRQRLASSAYAFRAATLDSSATIDGAQVTGSVASAGSANIATFAMLAGGLQGSLPGAQVFGALTAATIPAAQITGTLSGSQLSVTQLLPTTACATNQIPQWNGAVWVCATAPGSSGGNLDLTGNLTLPASTALAGNIFKGTSLFLHSIGNNNTFLGVNGGNLSLTGAFNTSVGRNSLAALTSGNSNTAVGADALKSHTSGLGNTAVGTFALEGNTSGFNNTAIGNAALSANVSGGNNTALGVSAMGLGANGARNTAVGVSALNQGTGSDNIALGNQAGGSIFAGSNNIAIGNPGDPMDFNTIRLGYTNQTRTFISGIRGVTPGIADGQPVIIDSNGQLGTGSVVSSGVTSVATGVGLTGGPITTTGTIGLAGTQLLPTVACATNQVTKWNGSAWACASDSVGGIGTLTSVTAGAGLTGGTITGSGTIAIDPAASVLTGNYIKQGGNTLGNALVIGTNDIQPLQFVIGGNPVIRVSELGAPNVMLGNSENFAGGVSVYSATVSGGGSFGFPNLASAPNTTVAGGFNNIASAFAGTVSGGFINRASGYGGVVPGGRSNTAQGQYSFAAGYRAKAVADGCFAWADNTEADFSCTFSNAFSVRASGGVYLRTNAAATTGCDIGAGGGAWACSSARETKTDFTTMNPIDVLTRVAGLPMTQWRYRTEQSGARHVGPMAEDFHAAFGLGDSTKTINVMDASGIALAAIQGLNQLVGKKDAEIKTQGERIKLLEDALVAIQARLGMR